jgi:hypothetical protein
MKTKLIFYGHKKMNIVQVLINMASSSMLRTYLSLIIISIRDRDWVRAKTLINAHIMFDLDFYIDYFIHVNCLSTAIIEDETWAFFTSLGHNCLKWSTPNTYFAQSLDLYLPLMCAGNKCAQSIIELYEIFNSKVLIDHLISLLEDQQHTFVKNIIANLGLISTELVDDIGKNRTIQELLYNH